MNLQEANEFISKLAKLLYKENGSDIILNANSNPALKINGKITYIKEVVVSSEDIQTIIATLLTKQQFERFETCNELNFMLDYPGVAYFRTNVFRQRGEAGLVMRLIPIRIPKVEDLGLPPLIKKFALLKRGLILFSGATGVGKSTSLASMIDYRNENSQDHIITIEDPIEFMHLNKKSIITQREIDVDTESYPVAMRNALRQAPDVILLGEIRTAEVMEQALAFAETGHLVLATIHATSAKLTLDRITSFFPYEAKKQILHDLADNLRAIVCQRLLSHASGKKRILALEVMTNTPHIQLLIRENRISEIVESMDRSTLSEGVISFDCFIYDLYEKGEINYDEAVRYVDQLNNFRVRVRSESNRPLPPELNYVEQTAWDLETALSEHNKKNTWGSFTRS